MEVKLEKLNDADQKKIRERMKGIKIHIIVDTCFSYSSLVNFNLNCHSPIKNLVDWQFMVSSTENSKRKKNSVLFY